MRLSVWVAMHQISVEDAAITILSSIDKALGNRSGIRRFGHASVPMDEALALLLWIWFTYEFLALSLKRSTIEKVSNEDLRNFFQCSLLTNMNSCIHVLQVAKTIITKSKLP